MSNIRSDKLKPENNESAGLSERKFQILFETMLQGIVHQDADGKIVSMNPAAERILGWTPEEFAGKTSEDVEHHTIKEDGSSFPGKDHPAMVSLRTGQEVHDVVMGVYHPQEKAYRWISVSAVPLFRPGENKAYQVYTLFDDITERKQAQEALVKVTGELEVKVKERTAELRKINEELQLRATILDKATDAILLRDLNNTFVYANDAASAIYGYRRDELIGMNFRSLIPPQEMLKFEERLKEVLEKGEMSAEGDHLRKDGSIVPVEVHSHPIKIGTREYILSVIRDITRRRQSQLRIQESEEKYRLLVENAIEAVTVVQDGLLKFFNRQMMGMSGYSGPELISKAYLDLVHPDDRTLVMGNYQKIITGEPTPSVYEFRAIRKDGDIRWAEIRSVLITWEGRPAVLGLMADITERKRMEQDLKAYAQKITRVQEEERKRIAYELHDDTAQYLSILKMQLDSLLQSGKIQDAEIIEKLRYLEKDADRAFQDVRRYSHELRPRVLEHLGLQAALEQMADDTNKLKQITVELTVEGVELDLPEDVRLGFFRIAQEALNNARKHAKSSKAIISLQFLENQIRITVSDSGPGFDMQEALNRTSLKGNLGLMSMQERAKLIGANLKIDSKPGTGTTVMVEMIL